MSAPDLFIPPADAAIWHTGAAHSQAARDGSAPSPVLSRVAGMLFLAASVGFLVVFAWLANAFAYPDVLDQPADQVLPALLALGGTGRAVWACYAVIPLLLVPAVAFSGVVLLPHAGGTAQRRAVLHTAVGLQTISSLAMTIGLARWSTIQWTLAQHASSSSADVRVALFAISDALNSYLGNALGEFVGELALYGVFVALGTLLWWRGVRWLGVFGMITALAGWTGMFRNITSIVDPVAAASNLLLPAFLITFGAWLLRARAIA